MPQLTDEENHLLRYYSERERVIHGPERSPAHQRLLARGYIEERPVNIQDLLITITGAGRAVLR